MNIDFNFVAEAVGHVAVAVAWALVRITPTVAATILVILDKMDSSKVEGLFRNNKRGF